MKTNVEFFGYGANRDPEMIKAIIGRLPEGYPATLQGFELCVQTWDEIPKKAKEVLSPPWNKKFKSYVLRPTLKPFKKVKGMVWLITKEERKLIDNWEMNGIWYQVYLLKFLKPAEQVSQIEIQVINDPNIKRTVNGLMYRNFINNKEQMLQVAEKVRKNFFKN